MLNLTHWLTNKQPVTLPTDEVHVWGVDLQLAGAQVNQLTQVLTADERDRANRFHFDRHRRRFIVRRAALRYILSHYLALPPAAIPFDYSEYGRPCVTAGRNYETLDFNLSDSHELAVVAVANGRSVGIDVEQVREVDDLMQLARYTFSAHEVTDLEQVAVPQRPVGFFNCWTRKEAYIKALGQGLSYPLKEFAVSLIPNTPARLIHDHLDADALTRWSMTDFNPHQGYLGALVVSGADWTMKTW